MYFAIFWKSPQNLAEEFFTLQQDKVDSSYLCVPLKDSTVIGVPQQPPTSLMLEKDSKKCQDCSIVFLTSFRLQRHIKKFHGGVTPTMANSDTPIGDDSNVAEMPRPYSCQLCQKNFTSHAYLVCFIYWQSSSFSRTFQRDVIRWSGANHSSFENKKTVNEFPEKLQ